jgi:hypothetical protein
MTSSLLRDAIESYRQRRTQIYKLAPSEALSNARGAKATARDHTARLVYELLQNAEDAGASEVSVELHKRPATLLFADNGSGITPEAVESLAGLFLSPKSVGIGRKGVGFKAVYSVTDNPAIVTSDDVILFSRVRASHWLIEWGIHLAPPTARYCVQAFWVIAR